MEPTNLSDFHDFLMEGRASDHPDSANFSPDMKAKMDAILAKRQQRRQMDPKAKKAADFFGKSVIKK